MGKYKIAPRAGAWPYLAEPAASAARLARLSQSWLSFLFISAVRHRPIRHIPTSLMIAGFRVPARAASAAAFRATFRHSVSVTGGSQGSVWLPYRQSQARMRAYPGCRGRAYQAGPRFGLVSLCGRLHVIVSDVKNRSVDRTDVPARAIGPLASRVRHPDIPRGH